MMGTDMITVHDFDINDIVYVCVCLTYVILT